MMRCTLFGHKMTYVNSKALFGESVTAILLRGYSRNWRAYKAALEPHGTGEPPSDRSKCPHWGRYVNGVNPYDDGETWRK